MLWSFWFMIKWSSYYLRAWFWPSSNTRSRHMGCFSQRVGVASSGTTPAVSGSCLCGVCFSTFSFLDAEKPKCDSELAFNPFFRLRHPLFSLRCSICAWSARADGTCSSQGRFSHCKVWRYITPQIKYNSKIVILKGLRLILLVFSRVQNLLAQTNWTPSTVFFVIFTHVTI